MIQKKELLGNFARSGAIYCREAPKVNDHDFKSAANGVVIPHGIYDLTKNVGYISLGTSKDTAAFVADNLIDVWQTYLASEYALADAWLLLCDGGGSNNARHHIVKQELQRVADVIDKKLRIAHFPAYCSKYNPIEHRLFPHMTRAAEGIVFDSLDTAHHAYARTATKQGLRVQVRNNTTVYQTKRPLDDDFHATKSIVPDALVGMWNYTIFPRKFE